MDRQARVFVAGHTGLVGSAIVRRLESEGFDRLILRTAEQVDLTDARATDRLFAETRPEYVFLAAAKVGGIHANNTYPADFIRLNLQIQTHVIDAAHRHGVTKLLFLGSSCIYPKLAPQPMKEPYLLSGSLEPTNQPYAIAKIAGIVMCESYNRQHGTNYIAAMPTNLYGPRDNFDLAHSHVLPAMVRKFHEARERGQAEVELWGTGTPRREFLYVEDLADALVHMMRRFDAGPGSTFLNVGVGEDVSIRELAELVSEVVGYKGSFRFNPAMPDGTPRKLLDVSGIHALGWRARTSLRDGIRLTYDWFRRSLPASPPPPPYR